MTPVQAAAIPLFLSHKDVIVQAVTGSGKTLAFIIPVLQILLNKLKKGEELQKSKVYSIILAPTRELAVQIHSVLLSILNCFKSLEDRDGLILADNERKILDFPITSLLFIGGTSVRQDIERFSKGGGHILIGTPGRMQDLLVTHARLFNCKDLEVLIMDEADRLLDLGFEKQLVSILSMIPKQRRTGLFSATMNEGLSRIVKAGLRNPISVVVKVQTVANTSQDNLPQGGIVFSEQTIPESLKIESIVCSPADKLSELLYLFHNNSEKKLIVYFANGACVEFYSKMLPLLCTELLYKSKGQLCPLLFHSLHGKMVPKRRKSTFENFSTSPGGSILLCTDVAARGIDLPDIDIVVQYDPPQDPKVFSHRCGRSGRAGREGRAVVFVSQNELVYPEFLRVRGIPLVERQEDQTEDFEKLGITGEKVFQTMLEFVKTDRDLVEKGVKAFVSWIRSYKEHQASFIFQLKEIDIVSVCKSFGLLRIPKVPELKSVDTSAFPESRDIEIPSIPYKDRSREKQRMANKIAAATEDQVDRENKSKKRRPVQTESWSVQKRIKSKRAENQKKSTIRKMAKATKKMNEKLSNSSKSKDWKDQVLLSK